LLANIGQASVAASSVISPASQAFHT